MPAHQPTQTSPTRKPGPRDPVAQLAQKVAHELNSPLDGVMRFIALAQRKIREKHYEDIERYLNDAEFGLQRMAEILRELTDVSTPHALMPAPARRIALHELLAQAANTLASQADASRVTLVIHDLLDPSPDVDVHLYQILNNLLRNAIEAMPAGGTATLATSRSGNTLTIRLLDTGPGLSVAAQTHLFQPFFTTKSATGGTGLGLALSQDILSNLGGTLHLANRTDATGCEARIELPLA